MENYFNLDIVEFLGLLLAAVAVITVIFSIFLVINYRSKNKISDTHSNESNNKKHFELLTPVILKRIENVTKIVEEKRHVQIIESEPEPKNKVVDDFKVEENAKVEQVDFDIEKDKETDAEEKNERDISERYKIENRFLRKPKSS